MGNFDFDPSKIQISFRGVSLIGTTEEHVIVVDNHEEVSNEDNDLFDDCYVHGQITATLKNINMAFFLTLCNTFECLNLVEECQA